MFRRKKWKYLILDEAHMIKNWKSQRWQTLLRFNAKRRLLITGARAVMCVCVCVCVCVRVRVCAFRFASHLAKSPIHSHSPPCCVSSNRSLT